MKTKKNLIIVGDRVLIDPDERMDKTPSGLYLPPTVKEKEKIMGGHVVKTGPGYAIPETTPDENWKSGKKEVKYLPLQAADGDYAIFLKDAAMEIEFEEKYLIVPIPRSSRWSAPNYRRMSDASLLRIPVPQHDRP